MTSATTKFVCWNPVFKIHKDSTNTSAYFLQSFRCDNFNRWIHFQINQCTIDRSLDWLTERPIDRSKIRWKDRSIIYSSNRSFNSAIGWCTEKRKVVANKIHGSLQLIFTSHFDYNLFQRRFQLKGDTVEGVGMSL